MRPPDLALDRRRNQQRQDVHQQARLSFLLAFPVLAAQSRLRAAGGGEKGQRIHRFGLFAALVTLSIAWSGLGCAPKVVSLGPSEPRTAWPARPFPASVLVEPFSGSQIADAARQRTGDLAGLLKKRRVFARVKDGRSEQGQADRILRGEVQSRWDPHGVSNFFTWWPGGLVFAPNWRGTRMQYFTDATAELIDTETGERIGYYTASTTHTMIHRSTSPGPFFGAIIIIPSVVRGALLTYPGSSTRSSWFRRRTPSSGSASLPASSRTRRRYTSPSGPNVPRAAAIDSTPSPGSVRPGRSFEAASPATTSCRRV
jgi:hypothetical protein